MRLLPLIKRSFFSKERLIVGLILSETLRKTRRQRQQERHQTKGLMS